MLGKTAPTFQGPLRVGKPAEGGFLGEVPLEPLVCTGSFADLWEGHRWLSWGREGSPGLQRPGAEMKGVRNGSDVTRLRGHCRAPRAVEGQKQQQTVVHVSSPVRDTLPRRPAV